MACYAINHRDINSYFDAGQRIDFWPACNAEGE